MPGPMFGSMSNWAHQAHIAISGLMTSIDQQGLGSCPNLISPNLHNKPTFESLTWWQVLSSGSQISGWQPNSPKLGGVVSVSSSSSMRSPSLPSNQAAKRRVRVLTISQREIQPITTTEPAITAALLIQTALLRANFRRSSGISFNLLSSPSWQRTRDDDAAASTNCRPTPA